jgi:hypothetical protein
MTWLPVEPNPRWSNLNQGRTRYLCKTDTANGPDPRQNEQFWGRAPSLAQPKLVVREVTFQHWTPNF